MEDKADHNNKARAIIAEAIKKVDEMSPQETDGKWLEEQTVKAAPHIKEWDIAECWLWGDWPEREKHFPNSTKQDFGIDVVAKRNDGAFIAIQCKARQLDEQGVGSDIASVEIDKFISASVNAFWKERWIVTNGANPLSANARQKAEMSDSNRPIKLVNLAADLASQKKKFDEEDSAASEHCAHCENPDDDKAVQTKSCMQNEAIAASVRILQEHAQSDTGGLPTGQARGRIILPCGTGKTRISLRIVEELTKPGELAIALCPSIALVAQIRREYLQNAKKPIRPLAVCSDETAGYDPRNEMSEDKRNTAATTDPTLDVGYTSADIVKGKVSTDPADIVRWIERGKKTEQISVIFGTYQSGRALADALKQAGAKASVLIADEAHRTAGLRRKNGKKKAAKDGELSKEEKRVRDFTLCHDNDEMPATYRVYQTATPRIYDTSKVNKDKPSDWIVRSMDDQETFGVELFRKSYVEAVNNGWLSDYRIIALGVNDREAYEQANELARETESKGRQRLTTSHYLRGMAFALAMGGEVESEDGGALPIQSCIAFMNTVDKSKNMAKDLQTDAVREWIKNRQKENHSEAADNFKLEHLDASSNVAKREEAKRQLANADANHPRGIINVGIFGEGTDSPSLSAVAFLEARKSPIDVVQAVGRAMRTSPGKQMGYIICPILIPPSADPENWISTSNPEDGWKELGQILCALRAHDSRIEDELKDLLQMYLPTAPLPKVESVVACAKNERISYRKHIGRSGEAQKAVERVLDGKSSLAEEFQALPKSYPAPNFDSLPDPNQPSEPTQIITGKKNADGSLELRHASVERDKPAPDGTLGAVSIQKSKKKANAMINKGEGILLTPSDQKPKRKTAKEAAEQRMLELIHNKKMSGSKPSQ